jgi:hypothetical protein
MVRLETLAGVVVAYLAPVTTVEMPGQNDVKATPRTGDKAAISRDRQLWTEEVHVVGKLLSSAELPAAHKTALETLFGGPCTAEDQARRLHHYLKKVGGSFKFYHRTRSYTATTNAAVNYLGGIWPVVTVGDFKESFPSGTEAIDVFLKLVVGLRSSV